MGGPWKHYVNPETELIKTLLHDYPNSIVARMTRKKPQWVGEIRRKYKIPKVKQMQCSTVMTEEKLAKAIELASTGFYSKKAIAREIGVSSSTVHNLFKDYDIECKGRHIYPEKVMTFIAELMYHGNVYRACLAAGLHPVHGSYMKKKYKDEFPFPERSKRWQKRNIMSLVLKIPPHENKVHLNCNQEEK